MTVSDLEPLYKLLSNSKVMQYLEAPYTKEQTEQFLFRSGLSETPLIYAVEKDNDFIGYVIYHDYDCKVCRDCIDFRDFLLGYGDFIMLGI